MLKPIYGSKDAPLAWRKKLHQVLVQWVSRRQFYAQPELYCVHKRDGWCRERTYQRANDHDNEQKEAGMYRTLEPQAYIKGRLQCLLSVHVDDMKGTAGKETAEPPLKHLNDKVGQCKADYNRFFHTSVQHECSRGSVFIRQCVYRSSVTSIGVGLLAGPDEDAECVETLHGTYRPVLGAVAWIALTRAELAVYVQALHRRGRASRIKDCKQLDAVIRYMKRHKCGLKSVTSSHPLRLVAFTNAAFKAQPQEPTGLALRG